jgi:toxin FitB
MPAIDALIAATGIAYELTVVTRNVTDMEQSGVKLLNPWLE